MRKIVSKHINWLSLDAELAAALVLVAVVVSLIIGGAQYWFAQRAASQYTLSNLETHLKQTLGLLERTQDKATGPGAALRLIIKDSASAAHADKDLIIFGLDPQGEVVAPPQGGPDQLPPPEVLRHMAGSAWGTLSLPDQEGGPFTAAYDRVPSGELIVGVAYRRPPLEMVYGFRLWMVSLLIALVMALLTTLAVVLWVRRILTKPLRGLVQEAEKAAQELVPPAVLKRSDELGRLSLALNSLANSARDMVDKAQEEQARFQRLFSQTKDGAFIIDQEGRISAANQALVAMLGYERRESLLGVESVAVHFADPEEAQLYLNSLQTQGYVQDFPATMRRPDGSLFEVLITSTWAGQGHARFGLLRDVTQLRKDQRALHESEARYRRLVDNAPDIIYRWSFAQSRFEYISTSAQEITGYSIARLLRNDPPLLRLIHPNHRALAAAHWREIIKGRGPAVAAQELMILDAQGRTRWLREKSILVRDELDKPLALEGIATEITERKLLEQELKRGQQMVENTLQGLPTAIMVLDREHRVVHWNRAMESLSGFSAQEMVGSNRQWEPFYHTPRPVLADLVLDGSPDKLIQDYQGMALKRSTLVEGGLEGEGFFPTLKPDGRQLYFLAAPIRGPEGRVVRAVETLVDLSDKRHLEQELRKLSVTDSLTGLYNQRFFYATLGREMQTAQRYGHPLSVLMADIDFFKAYNDRFGHLAGDHALARFSRTLQGCVRGMDLACRYGGEEFAALLPHAAMTEALGVAERLRAGIARQDFTPQGSEDGEGVRLTVSVGVATLGPAEEAQAVVGRADSALYAAKQGGRNLVAANLGQGRIDLLPRGATALSSGK